ncbi:HD domain-containing protein [Nocardioides hankookensis]|uniref:Metal-dependent phosphohydrolase n=1 Tax=Nocardioides hankookensis TaxID=443157 RepID=A0ABW1LM45_9ACTN
MDLLLAWPLPGARPLGAQLVASYDHPDRRYHDGEHLAEVLERIHELTAHGVEFDRMAVLLAAWFHDSVYDAQPDAEKRSAAWAAEALPTLVDQAVVDEVVRLVLVTEHHQPADDDANGCALSDADLAILAAPAERYAEYAASVREEYAAVPDDAFAAGRAAILRELLAKPHLFHTAYARDAWEADARANVERELAELAP